MTKMTSTLPLHLLLRDLLLLLLHHLHLFVRNSKILNSRPVRSKSRKTNSLNVKNLKRTPPTSVNKLLTLFLPQLPPNPL
jgi:hypothetical protein